MSLIEAIKEVVGQDIARWELSAGDRKRVHEVLLSWLDTQAVFRPLPDLDARRARLRQAIGELASTVEVRLDHSIVIVSSSSAKDSLTLNLLFRGSSWFSPYHNLVYELAEAVFMSHE